MFNENQTEALEAPLNRDRVSKRKAGGGMQLSYLEGWDVIDTANAIFGYGMWDHEVVSLDIVEERVDGDFTHIGYRALVRTIVRDEEGGASVHEDVGFGNGKSKRPFDAHELAGKEAVTDAMKRALRAYGNQFGNALYDKQQRNVTGDDVEVEVKTPEKKKPKGEVQEGDTFPSYDYDNRPKGAVRISKTRFAMVGDINNLADCRDVLSYNENLLKWYEDKGKTESIKYAKTDIDKIKRKLSFLEEEAAKD